MKREVSLYRYVCVSGVEWEEWFEDPPIECPDGHSIQSGTLAIIDDVAEQHVSAVIIEESIPTGGHFQCSSKSIHSTASGITTVEISWPYQISLLSAELLVCPNAKCGDWVEAHVGPDTVVGALTSTVTSGSVELYVSSTVIENVAIGFYITVAGKNLGRVLAVGDSTITIESPADIDLALGEYVLQTIKLIDRFDLGLPGRIPLGGTKVGASHIPANTAIRYIHHNCEDVEKGVLAKIEYLY